MDITGERVRQLKALAGLDTVLTGLIFMELWGGYRQDTGLQTIDNGQSKLAENGAAKTLAFHRIISYDITSG